MGKFIDTNYQIMKVFLERAVEKSKQKEGADFTYLLNQANLQMLEGIKRGLATKEALDYFLMGSWLAMAAAEVDSYPYGKYSKEEREKRKSKFIQDYSDNIYGVTSSEDQIKNDKQKLGKFFVEESRIDLIPQVALERLGIHNELCAIKWKDPTVWQREGFIARFCIFLFLLKLIFSFCC